MVHHYGVVSVYGCYVGQRCSVAMPLSSSPRLTSPLTPSTEALFLGSNFLLPAMVDQGVTIYQMTSSVFIINPITACNQPQMMSVPSSDHSRLRLLLNIKYKASVSQHKSYYDHYNKYMGPLPWGNLAVGPYQYGGFD